MSVMDGKENTLEKFSIYYPASIAEDDRVLVHEQWAEQYQVATTELTKVRKRLQDAEALLANVERFPVSTEPWVFWRHKIREFLGTEWDKGESDGSA